MRRTASGSPGWNRPRSSPAASSASGCTSSIWIPGVTRSVAVNDRRANTARMSYGSSLSSENIITSRVATSTQCASSTAISTGPSSATAASAATVATEIANRSGGGPACMPRTRRNTSR